MFKIPELNKNLLSIAWNGVSFSPEKRAEAFNEDFEKTLSDFAEKVNQQNITMDIKLKNLKQEYMGRCNIIPCCDLPKIEGSFNDLKDDIIDSFVNQNIISDWTLKDGVLEKYNNNEEFDNDDEREEEFWNEVVCRCLNKGYLVIYELPVPNGIHKNNEKIEYFSYSWGYFQTHFIHITDLAQLTSVLSNLDDMIIEEKYKEEQQKKEK